MGLTLVVYLNEDTQSTLEILDASTLLADNTTNQIVADNESNLR